MARLIRNAALLLGSDVASRASTFVMYALVGRHLGTVEFGQLALALSLFYVFHVLAGAGLKTLVTREVTRNHGAASDYFGNGALVILLSSALSIAGLLAFVRMAGYSADTAAVIVLISLGLPAYALTVLCDAIFQAADRIHLSAAAQLPVHVAKVAVAALLLSRGYGLMALIAVLVGSHALIFLIECWLLFRHIRIATVAYSADFALRLARTSSTFLGIDALIAVTGSYNVVVLSIFAAEREVGLYSAAAQLLIPVRLFYQAIALSAFPVMCRSLDLGISGLTLVANRVIALLLAVAVPTAVALFFLADPALALLYGDRGFHSATPAFQVMVWALIPLALTSALGQVLLANSRESLTLRILIVDTAVTVIAGYFLIRHFGVIGAAAAGAIANVVDLIQHYVQVRRVVYRVRIHALGWKPLAAGVIMAVYLAAVHQQAPLANALGAVATYTAVLAALTLLPMATTNRLAKRPFWLSLP